MSNIQNDFISGIGNTPLIKLRAASEITGCNIYGKAEFLNPGGSVKDRAALALIKDDVVIGLGAQVLGPVTVGRCAKIGANAVITKDVPEKAVMVGIPAKNVGLADSEFKPYGITSDSDTKSE